MKKLSKIIITASVFLFFSIFTLNIAMADVTVWQYTKNTLPPETLTFASQTTAQTDCNADRARALLLPVSLLPSVTNCVQTTVPSYPIEATTTRTPVVITGQNNATDSTTYNLLAPIGNLKVAPTNVGDYFNTIFLIAIGLCGALAVIMIVIGGIQYMGNESIFGKTEAKSRITSAILGLLIALGAYALLNTINPDLLKANVNVAQVTGEMDEETTPWTTYEKGDNTTACPGGFQDVTVPGANPSSINVCGTVATNLASMINAAKRAGLTLSGTGSRSNGSQIQKRINNCGGSANIYNKNAVCVPATALPGTSNHEKGLAVDFNCNGTQMGRTDTSNVCYVWLTKNAGTYGFANNYNVLKETWHWSTGAKAGY